MNPSKQQQQQTSSSTKKQSASPQQNVKTNNSHPSTPNSRKPNQSQGRRQQQQAGGQNNKKRNSPSYSNQMEFLSFQPALQECFQTPQQQQYERRSSPRGGNNGSVISQSAKYSSQVNGYNNSLSPIKLASPAIAPIIRQGNNQQQSSAGRRQRGSPLALFKHTPFAGAKYLELPSTKSLPLPPTWLIEGTAAPTSSNEASLSSSPTSMIEPPSPTTEAAIKVAKENGFDGRVRIHPLQLIAAVSSC